MAILPITKGPENPILRAASSPVKKIDKKLRKLIQDMFDTMVELKGVGIAAPQVGVNLQLALARLNVDTKQEALLILLNPQILQPSKGENDLEEGCLSLPGYWGVTPRHDSLTLVTGTLKGEKLTLHFEGFNARVVQHEVDHLNGKLFIDRAESVKIENRGAEHEK